MKILPTATSMIARLVSLFFCFRCPFGHSDETDSSDKSNYPKREKKISVSLFFLFPVQSYIRSNFSRITHQNVFEWNTVRGFCDCFRFGKIHMKLQKVYFFFSNFGIFCMVTQHTQLGLGLSYVFLPLYHNLGLTSSFEYLERRFDRRIRLLASFIYTLKYILFIPAVIYEPSLVFSQDKLLFRGRRSGFFELHQFAQKHP